MKRFFLSVLMIVSVVSCNYLANVKLLTGGSVSDKNYVHTIPFIYKKGLIVIEARVNEDETPRQFIFDTGAFNSKIEKGMADSLGMKTYATKDNSTAAGVSREIEVTRIKSLRLGDALFQNIGAGKLNYDSRSASPCIANDGIIGANLIKLAQWKIDYESKELTFSDSPMEHKTNENLTPIKFKRPVFSGVPEINIQVGARTVEGVLFDVGYNGGLVLPAQFADSFAGEPESIVYDRSTTGIYGSKTDTLLTKELEVSLGDHAFIIPVEFSSNGKALLGNEVLEHFDVYINYRTKRIILEQKSPVEILSIKDFIPGIVQDSIWVVNRTHPNLSLELGDTLTFINGLTAHEAFPTHCDYVMNIGAFLEQPLEVTTKDGVLMSIRPNY